MFEGMDEQEMTDKLERICGGPSKTFRMLDIYKAACSSASSNEFGIFGPFIDTKDTFRKRASDEGYSEKQVVAFLEYQGKI